MKSLTSRDVIVPATTAETFVLLTGGLTILLSLLVRIRTFGAMAIRPADPALWIAAGLIQDLAICAAVAFPLQSIARRAPKLAALLALVFAAVHAMLHLVFSELIIVLGQTLRLSELRVGFRRSLVQGSLDRGTVVALIVAGVVVIAGAFALRSVARRMRAKFSGLAHLMLVLLPLSAAMLTRFVYDVKSAANPLVTAALIVASVPAERGSGALPARPSRAITDVRRLAAGAHNQWLNDDYPLVRQVAPGRLQIPPGVKPNIVILLLESLRAREVGAYGSTAGLTPAIDELARRGIVVERAYSAGTRTPEGELALWYGLLADPTTLVMNGRSDAPLSGLPEHLRAAGWRQFLWFNASDQTFYGNDVFYRRRGFDIAGGTVFPPYAPRTGWGYSDRALVRYSVEALGRAPEPFAAMLLTTSNHHPFELPRDADEMPRHIRRPAALGQLAGNYASAMAQTIAYTDDAVRLFFERARSQPWFAHTIFIIAGDHGNAVEPAEGNVTAHELAELQHRVPLIIYSPMLAGGQTVGGVASQVDVLPTLLGLLGIRGPAPIIGANLFAEPRRGPVISWDAGGRVTIRTADWTWHGVTTRGGGFRGEMLFHRSDPRGVDDRIAVNPEVARELRELASIYRDVYPWLVASGRAGMPPH
ncbi:MAG TPA: LTA synthase family protein [Thermoanaerobaculia bacterium]|jgi:phosphoglycerol transferase MdoB-like AlkP superfamily enzyme